MANSGLAFLICELVVCLSGMHTQFPAFYKIYTPLGKVDIITVTYTVWRTQYTVSVTLYWAVGLKPKET